VGVYGYVSATAGGTRGVWGRVESTSGGGVYGEARATTGNTYGVYGRSASSEGIGVYGEAIASSGSAYGVVGTSSSTSGIGVSGSAAATSGFAYGVRGQSQSASGAGVYGIAMSTWGITSGVYGRSESTDGTGVYGIATATSGVTGGVYGIAYSPNGYGIRGEVTATTGTNYGVYGFSPSTAGRGVMGVANSTTGTNYGVFGISDSMAGYGVYAGGRFAASGTKSFQIDHPLRPETHYLNHFCAEGPEPYNIYRGSVTLDTRGEAWVQLPDYFEAINRDPTITLTPVGVAMPNLYIAAEIQGNRFKIAGGLPGKKVYWRVEAVRNDPWVQRYGYQTEQEKEEDLRGKYLHPELYGQPRAKRIHVLPEPREEKPPQ
jgi:hypothetical protein